MNNKLLSGIIGILILFAIIGIGYNNIIPRGDITGEATLNYQESVEILPSPAFALQTTNGKDIILTAEVPNEKPIVLYFMTSSCTACARNWKAINNVLPEYKDNIDFTAVSIDPTDTNIVLAKLAKDRNFVFDTVAGNPTMKVQFNAKQDVVIAIDINGNIIKRHEGTLESEGWKEFFEFVI